MLPKVNEAEISIESYRKFGGEEIEVKSKLFKQGEVERAETIVNSLKGMSIASAQQLLEKVNRYILMETIK